MFKWRARKAGLSRVPCFDREEDTKQNERESKSNKVWKNPVEVRLFSFFSRTEPHKFGAGCSRNVCSRCRRTFGRIAFANSLRRIAFKIGSFTLVRLR